MNRHDYAVLTPLVWLPHCRFIRLSRQISDIMSTVTPCHVPLTVTSEGTLTLTCYSSFVFFILTAPTQLPDEYVPAGQTVVKICVSVD